MNNVQMLAALSNLPEPELLRAGSIADPLGSNTFYSARTVVMLLAAERRRCAKDTSAGMILRAHKNRMAADV